MRKEVEHAIPGDLVYGYYLGGDKDESHYIELRLMIWSVEPVGGEGNEEGVFHLEKGGMEDVVENTSFAGMPTELIEHLLEDRNKGFVAVEDEVVVGNKKGKRVEHLDLESNCHEAVELGMDKVGWVR